MDVDTCEGKLWNPRGKRDTLRMDPPCFLMFSSSFSLNVKGCAQKAQTPPEPHVIPLTSKAKLILFLEHPSLLHSTLSTIHLLNLFT